MKIIVAPDKFKGSLTSLQACKAIEAGILQTVPGAKILLFPMADGGDGFDVVLQYYLRTKTIECNTVDPLMRPICATYQLNAVDKTAIIALSAASGLVRLKEEERNPLHTSTYGSGIMIQHAINNGAEKVILGLGGSATNDAGLGILAALGFQLLDQEGNPVTPEGKNLLNIQRIIPPSALPGANFQIASDVENTLCGEAGASFVYASQKGALEQDIVFLDKGLQHIAEIMKASTGKDVAGIQGTGAAGGVAAGLMAYFNCNIIPGAKLVMNASNISEDIIGTALIITGEGRLDMQSTNGKVVQHIADLGMQYSVPVMALCGSLALDQQQVKTAGLTAAFQIIKDSITPQYAMDNADILLTELSRAAIEHFLQSYEV